MRRQPRLTAFCLPFALVLLLGIGLQPLASQAQDDTDAEETADPTRPNRVRPGEEGLILFALVNDMPAAPSFVRLLRINLAPGAQSPLHVHPGPEMGVIESGVSSVQVEGPTDLLPAGRTKPISAPEGEEFEMERGDQVLYPTGSPQSFVNNSEDDNTVILSAVILPAGSPTPPGLTWVGGTPGPNALAGLTSVILGDGVASQLPTGQTGISIERLIVEPGESIPASDVPTMLSLEDGRFDFTTVSGETQVSRTTTPGPQEAAPLEEEFSLAPGDAAFFPTGIEEVERPESDGQVTMLRMTIAEIPTTDAASPTASPVAEDESERAVIEITEAQEPTPAPTQDAESADDGVLGVGDVVAVNEAEVRLRDAPTVNSNIVTGLDQGAEFTITDGPVEADGFVWFAVESTVDSAIVGWIAADFISPV